MQEWSRYDAQATWAHGSGGWCGFHALGEVGLNVTGGSSMDALGGAAHSDLHVESALTPSALSMLE